MRMYYKDHIMKVLPFIRNKFIITIVVFVIWMMFFDQYNLISRINNNRKIAELEQQKEYYIAEIQRSERLLQELEGDNQSLEKFAREQYLMKKEDEDIYIVKVK